MYDNDAEDGKSTDTEPTRRTLMGATAAVAALPAPPTDDDGTETESVAAGIDGSAREGMPPAEDWSGHTELPARPVGAGQLHLAGDLLAGRRAGDAEVVAGYTDAHAFAEVNVATAAGEGGIMLCCSGERLTRLATALRERRPMAETVPDAVVDFSGQFLVEHFDRRARLEVEPAGEGVRVSLRTVDGDVQLAVATEFDAETAARVAAHLETAAAEYSTLEPSPAAFTKV